MCWRPSWRVSAGGPSILAADSITRARIKGVASVPTLTLRSSSDLRAPSSAFKGALHGSAQGRARPEPREAAGSHAVRPISTPWQQMQLGHTGLAGMHTQSRAVALWALCRVMIIDLDAHQGNGYERDFLGTSGTGPATLGRPAMREAPVQRSCLRLFLTEPKKVSWFYRPWVWVACEQVQQILDFFQPRAPGFPYHCDGRMHEHLHS